MRDSGTGEDKGSFPKCLCGRKKIEGAVRNPYPEGTNEALFFSTLEKKIQRNSQSYWYGGEGLGLGNC